MHHAVPQHPLRVLIAEDEELAREKLLNLLSMDDSLEVIGSCRNGTEALKEILKLEPDLVFLDIKLPEMDGFSVLEQLEGKLPRGIVFVTAYDSYAVKAFEVNAVDFLLKPFDAARLKQCLAKVKQRLCVVETTTLQKSMNALILEFKQQNLPQGNAPVVVKSDGKMLFFEPSDIQWIEADDNYAKFHTITGDHLTRETLQALEARLNSAFFIRISRSSIVNITWIKEIQPMFHGDSVVILKNGARLTASRRYRDKIKTALKDLYL